MDDGLSLPCGFLVREGIVSFFNPGTRWVVATFADAW